MPFVPFNEYSYTIEYQIKKIHGLPIVRKRLTDDFYTLKESIAFLTDEFMCNADLVAYKGGDIERTLLNNMGVRCINLEILTCPKYADLLTIFGQPQECCPYHLGNHYHCSKHETQLVRCQSLTIPNKYYVDEHYFHVGSGECNEDSSEIEVFAAAHLYVGLKSIMRHFASGLHVNMGEMLMALDCNIENLNYYQKEVSRDEFTITVIYSLIKKKGMFIRKYLAHILVCKKCSKYLEDFLTLLDQSVEDHPFSAYDELQCDGYNRLGLPILRHILDADFDSLMGKAYYGVIDGQLNTCCEYVDAFMDTYVIKHV
ncbi:Hypothetical predicted protein [Paramuricea clavata]|uniref:Uncharacterized protein n=1 Tax=Paramuricea clavata TaxID=317549 RepID=A0A6S7FL21_PARCT|nr:Hypothetical predicted protein [Paramuricea clavata]